MRCAQKVQIPLNPQNGRPRGFAFAQLTDIKTAAKAVKSLNDTEFKGRKIGVAVAVDKRYYQAPAKEEPEEEAEGSEASEAAEVEAKEAPSESEDEDDENKPISDPKLKRKIMKDRKMSRKEKRELIFGSARPADGQTAVADDTDHSKDEEIKCTLFVSNLDFEMTADAFKEHARKLGKIRYAVVG